MKFCFVCCFIDSVEWKPLHIIAKKSTYKLTSWAETPEFINNLFWGYLVHRQLTGLLYQPWMMDDECGAVRGMRVARGNRSTRRKLASLPLCPPQIPHDLIRSQTQAAAVGSLSYGTALTTLTATNITTLTSNINTAQQTLTIPSLHHKMISAHHLRRQQHRNLQQVSNV
jgi:hypothetical protein